jgi:hypothetical protein
MTRENQFFVVDVMIIDITRKMVALSVISQLVGLVIELSAIVNIHKYRGLHEGHHFILMAMEVHDAPERDMDRFIKECVCLFHDRQSGFCMQFFNQHVNIAF